MNALRFVMSGHDRIEGLLVDLSQASPTARESIYGALMRAIEAHFDVEEQIFYPEVSPRLILVKADPFLAEHKEIRETAARLQGALSAPDFAHQLQELHDVLVRHISDEEIELLAEVKRRFDVDELDDLGARMEAASRPVTALEEPVEQPAAGEEEGEEEKAESPDEGL
jgi:hemerythrin-like domain-containing protein